MDRGTIVTATIRLNANTPFLEGVPNSKISKEWYRALFSVIQILGNGVNVTNLPDLEALEVFDQPSLSAQAALQQGLDSLSVQVSMEADQTSNVVQLRAIVSDAITQLSQQEAPTAAISQLVSLLSDALIQLSMHEPVVPAGSQLSLISDLFIQSAMQGDQTAALSRLSVKLNRTMIISAHLA